METDPRCGEEDSDTERERPRDPNPPSEEGNENIAEEPLVGEPGSRRIRERRDYTGTNNRLTAIPTWFANVINN